jgi:hypothetical protein
MPDPTRPPVPVVGQARHGLTPLRNFDFVGTAPPSVSSLSPSIPSVDVPSLSPGEPVQSGASNPGTGPTPSGPILVQRTVSGRADSPVLLPFAPGTPGTPRPRPVNPSVNTETANLGTPLEFVGSASLSGSSAEPALIATLPTAVGNCFCLSISCQTDYVSGTQFTTYCPTAIGFRRLPQNNVGVLDESLNNTLWFNASRGMNNILTPGGPNIVGYISPVAIVRGWAFPRGLFIYQREVRCSAYAATYRWHLLVWNENRPGGEMDITQGS